ncbi:MAG: response regulator transcription factor [Tissierellia bacterium]|nr:response regulator transcription factor [Tissierellia bacterium]
MVLVGKNLEIIVLSQILKHILKILGEGLSNYEIARKLYISENTVKKHVSNILSKLELSHRTQAALYAQNMELRYTL